MSQQLRITDLFATVRPPPSTSSAAATTAASASSSWSSSSPPLAALTSASMPQRSVASIAAGNAAMARHLPATSGSNNRSHVVDAAAAVAQEEGFYQHTKRPRAPTIERNESRELLELQQMGLDGGGWQVKRPRSAPAPPINQNNDAGEDLDSSAEVWEFPSLDEDTLARIAEAEATVDLIDGVLAIPETYFVAEFKGDEDRTAAVDAWDADHVKLPSSRKNCFKDSEGRLKLKWDLIRSALSAELATIQDLQDAILMYNDYYASEWNFAALHHFFNDYMTVKEKQDFFSILVLFEGTKVANGHQDKHGGCAVAKNDLVRQPIRLLSRGQARSITLSQIQIACLLANAFFCTYPRRNSVKPNSEYYKYPSINFNTLFGAVRGECSPKMAAKFRCLLHYFRRVTDQGVVTFTRKVMKKDPVWHRIDAVLGPLEVRIGGTIEDDGEGMLQMDFANRLIGGGVLSSGAVQEEIRFLICPELIVSRLFTERLEDNEAVLITGPERFSNYTGYSSTFAWDSNHIDRTSRDGFERRQTQVVAVDALHFSRRWHQYYSVALKRELNKATVAFHTGDGSGTSTVAAGLWGCGAFNGDPQLKSLIQLMACAVTKRPMRLFTFGDVGFAQELEAVYGCMRARSVTVAQLFDVLLKYCSRVNGNREDDILFDATLFEYCAKELSLPIWAPSLPLPLSSPGEEVGQLGEPSADMDATQSTQTATSSLPPVQSD